MELVIYLSVLYSFLAIGLIIFCLLKGIYVAILAVLYSALSMRITNVMDDLLGWRNKLKEWQKPIFTNFAAMHLMVIKIKSAPCCEVVL